MLKNFLQVTERRPEVWRRAGMTREQQRAKREWQTFWRFFMYCWPQIWIIVLFFGMAFTAIPMGQIGVFLYRFLVDEVILNTDASVDHRLKLFWIVVGIQCFLYLLDHVYQTIGPILGFYVHMKVTLRLRTVFYDHLHRLSLGFLYSRPVGEHMFRGSADISGSLVSMIFEAAHQIIIKTYQIVWACILLYLVDPWLTVIIACYLIPFGMLIQFIYTLIQRVLWDLNMIAQYARAILRDGIAGTKTVKSYGRIRWVVGRYLGVIIENIRYDLRMTFVTMLAFDYVIWSYSMVMERFMWFYVGYQTMVGNLSIGEFSVVLMLGGSFKGLVQAIIQQVQGIRLQLVQAERILQTLDVKPEIADAPDAVTMPPLQGRIEFRNVNFEYQAGTPVLQDVNVTIEPGQRVAFVGPSGAGKTSAIYLLLRLYEPTTGQILVDGVDLRSIKLLGYREQLGVVLQETFLFGGTVRENVRYGRLRALDEEVEEATQRADLQEFVTSHPDGFDRDIGEGTRLSGGQKQRIGIARALIRDPAILVLDEATSSLDTRSEEHVMQTVRKAWRGRTTVMVSHRLVTVMDADTICVLDEGRIVERGTHEDLLAQGGLYRRMWEEQTRPDEIARI